MILLVIVAATKNPGKIREFNQLFSDLDIRVIPISHIDSTFSPEETGCTFKENALIKARAAALETGMVAMADDSGLEVDVLDGRPGVYSAHYAGEARDDQANNEKLMEEIRSYPLKKRTARFRAVVAVVFPDGREYTSSGRIDGLILDECRGSCGFGYDPLFYLPDRKKTLAELSTEEKNHISHRARAFAGIRHVLKDLAVNS